MIKIYTLSHHRPDFIPLQYESIKKYVKDEFEYIVINNAVDNEKNSSEIERVCKDLGVSTIKV